MIVQLSNYFFRAAPEDRQIIANLCEAFQDNQRMKALLGKRSNAFQKGLNIIIAYCYFMVKKLDGIFISSNRSTYLLYYKKSHFYSTFFDRLRYLYMALFVIGAKRLPKIYLREKFIKGIRKKAIEENGDQDYWYIWFLAQNINEKSIKGLVEAKNHILQLVQDSDLPIYMETTEERLLAMYERVGFQFYTCEVQEKTGLKVWFGRLGK